MSEKPTYEELEQRVLELEKAESERKLTEREPRENEIRLQSVFDAVEGVPVQGYNRDRRVIYWNRASEAVYGYSHEEAMGSRLEELIIPEPMREKVINDIRRWHDEGIPMPAGELTLMGKDKGPVHVYCNHVGITNHRGEKEMFCIDIDLTVHKQAEAKLLESEKRYRSLVENTMDGYFIAEIPSGQFIFLNQRICDLFGYTLQEGLAHKLWDVTAPEEHALIQERIQSRMEDIETSRTSHIYNAIRKEGDRFRAEVSYSLITYQGKPVVQGILRDVTEEEKLLLQLHQSQKMESVGRLAGGVAHDFNNMLGVIIGHTELVMEQTDLDSPMYDDLKEIYKASRRSADLTRQLLAFARKQMTAPKVIDINDTVSGMLKMLQRLIGEDIDLVFMPGANLWPVKIDPGQIDQIMANLCINARDAIGGVGKVAIETENIVLDQVFCSEHAGSIPGDYILIKVIDDGCGMDNPTLEKLFEPFFTTKEVGEGTGLGLSTVYGIIKQNHGYIDVYSQPGQGATFKVYLPRTHAILETKEKPGSGTIQKGTETVLLVEDEASVLRLAKSVLERFGYTVLEAQTPEEALSIAEKHEDPIHLLITDVVMPEMNGKDLKSRIEDLKPNVKVMFMSGYTANVIVHQGILEENVHFIPKPFSVKDLAGKVREVLDE